MHQNGFALLELTVAMALMLLIAVWGASALVGRYSQQVAQADAVWMQGLQAATDAYLAKYRSKLILASEPSALLEFGYADWAKPTLSELSADELLAPHFPVSSKSFGAKVQLLRQEPCQPSACRIQALVYSSQPYIKSTTGGPDETMIAEWLQTTKGQGGHVPVLDAGRIRSAAFDLTNPPWPGQPLPKGTVALMAGQSSVISADGSDAEGGTEDYLKVGDARDPDFQGTLTVANALTANQELTVNGTVQINAVALKNSGCAVTGALSRTAAGELLSCRGGVWAQAGPRRLGAFSSNSIYGCFTESGASTANPVTQNCSCPYGAAMVLVSDSGPAEPGEPRVYGFVCVD